MSECLCASTLASQNVVSGYNNYSDSSDIFGLFNPCKNNSNSSTEVVKSLIDAYEISLVLAINFNHKWLQKSEEELAKWYLQNYAKVIDKVNELEKEFKKIVPYETELREDIDIQELKKKLKEDIRNVEFEQLDIVDFAAEKFAEYLEKAKKKYKLFKNVKEKKRVISKALHRFTRSYQKKIKIQLAPLLEGEGYRNAVFLTLTLDPKKFRSRYDMWGGIIGKRKKTKGIKAKRKKTKGIKADLNRFLTALFKKIGHRIEYITTTEAQRNGNPHLHILFLNAKRLLDYRIIRKLWAKGHIWINKTKEGKKIGNPIAYMTKYLTKNFNDTNSENRLTQALLWLFHVRSYSTSQGLVVPLNQIGRGAEGEWEMEGMLVIGKGYSYQIEANLWDIVEELRKGNGG